MLLLLPRSWVSSLNVNFMNFLCQLDTMLTKCLHQKSFEIINLKELTQCSDEDSEIPFCLFISPNAFPSLTLRFASSWIDEILFAAAAASLNYICCSLNMRVPHLLFSWCYAYYEKKSTEVAILFRVFWNVLKFDHSRLLLCKSRIEFSFSFQVMKNVRKIAWNFSKIDFSSSLVKSANAVSRCLHVMELENVQK